MTKPKPTPEQIQRACDLAGSTSYFPHQYDNGAFRCLTALADTIAQLDAMQAERDKAMADLGEIARISDYNSDDCLNPWDLLASANSIAAPYRVETDPLYTMAQDIANTLGFTGASGLHSIRADDFRKVLHAELSKRWGLRYDPNTRTDRS